MKKKFLITLVLFTLILTGCGKSATQTEANSDLAIKNAKEKPLNLTGNWIQEEKSNKGYQVGYISGDRIEIFWINDEENTHYLYWSGTYEAPKKMTKTYIWESKNDKTQTELAFVASNDDKKTFTYKNGKLFYEVSAFGKTVKMQLIKTKTNYKKFSKVKESADTSNLKKIKVNKSGYSAFKRDDYTVVSYAVDISNVNKEYAIQYPKIVITAKDSNGKILKTETQILNGIAAGDRYNYGNFISYNGELPKKVEISVKNDEYKYIGKSNSDIFKSELLSISNISERKDYSNVFTGEVKNNTESDIDNAAVVIIYKFGDKIIGGDVTYVQNLKKGEKMPFEIDAYSGVKNYDSYEINAIKW